MTDTASQVAPAPQSTCGACGQTDDHPKHLVIVGFSNEHTSGRMFHEHDGDRDGVVAYHYDCPSVWHQRVNPEYHAKVAALAASGVRGDDLRRRIQEGTL